MARLSRNFYNRDTVAIARDLLGKYLVRTYRKEFLVCRITETEAYIGRCDKACHAYNYHRTQRNSVMFGEPGHAYLYLIYGMHCCLNFVTEPKGEPSAVLIRGAEPVAGVEMICHLRYGRDWDMLTPYQQKNFMNGPGKLCKGLGLSRDENGVDLTENLLFVCDSPTDLDLPCPVRPRREIVCSGSRIGVDYAEEAKDFPWRFWLSKED